MTITPDQADRLNNNRTPGRWIMEAEDIDDSPTVNSLHRRGGLTTLTSITDNGYLEDGDAALIAAAPDLAQTIAGMRWEWTCEWDDVNGAEHGPWHALRREAEIDVQDMAGRGAIARIVRRLVGPVEEAE